MENSDLLQRLLRAEEQLGTAEGELDAVFRAIKVSPGTEKITVSQALEDAFDKLRSAKADLAELKRLLSDETG